MTTPSHATLTAMNHMYWTLHSSDGTQSEAEQWVYRQVYYTLQNALFALQQCDSDAGYDGYRVGRYAMIYNHAIAEIEHLVPECDTEYKTLYLLALAQLEQAKTLDVFGTVKPQ